MSNLNKEGGLVTVYWIVTIVLSIFAAVISWNLVEPDGLFSFIGFLLVCGILCTVANFLAMGIVWLSLKIQWTFKFVKIYFWHFQTYQRYILRLFILLLTFLHDEKSNKRILKKISFHPLPTFFSAYVLRLLQPESRFTPTPARLPTAGRHFFQACALILIPSGFQDKKHPVQRRDHCPKPKLRSYLYLPPTLYKWTGLFLSIPESKQNLKEKEKFRVSEEITPSKLGFVKMRGEDKKQP